MDWKFFADHFDTMTCVLSVEKSLTAPAVPSAS